MRSSLTLCYDFRHGFRGLRGKDKEKSVLLRVIPRPEREHDKVFSGSPESPA